MNNNEKLIWRAHYFRVLKIISDYEHEGRKSAIGWPTLDPRFYSSDILQQEGYGRLRDLIHDLEMLDEIQQTDKGLLIPKMSDEEINKLTDKLMLRRFPEQ